MKRLLLSAILCTTFFVANAQTIVADSMAVDTAFAEGDTSLLMDDMMTETPSLLPERMIFTQRWIYGEKGLLRATGIVPLTLENRENFREFTLEIREIPS